jgi:hypothetical protein
MARMLCKQHKEFASIGIDAMRARIRYRRGETGTDARRRAGAGIVPTEDTSYFPLPLHSKKEPYNLPVVGDILYVGDLHVPYHEPFAIRAMIEYCKDHYDIKAVVFNGDTMDCYDLSSFAKSHDAPTMQEEVDLCEDVLDVFQDAFPGDGVKWIWKDGNHEQRLHRYVCRNVPELASLIVESPADLVRARERGFEYVGPLQLILAGKLLVVHGHEIKMNSPGVNAARTLWLRAKTTALTHHLHTTCMHTEKSLGYNAKTHMCWSVGCLSDLQPDYNPHSNKYNLGFAVQQLKPDGNFRIDNKRILKSGEVV